MLHIHKDLKDNLDLHVWEITKGFTFFINSFAITQAAQGGSLSCLHWLLESGMNSNLQDGKFAQT